MLHLAGQQPGFPVHTYRTSCCGSAVSGREISGAREGPYPSGHRQAGGWLSSAGYQAPVEAGPTASNISVAETSARLARFLGGVEPAEVTASYGVVVGLQLCPDCICSSNLGAADGSLLVVRADVGSSDGYGGSRALARIESVTRRDLDRPRRSELRVDERNVWWLDRRGGVTSGLRRGRW